MENRISIWLKLKRVVALVLLYKRKLLESVKTNKELSPEIHRSYREKLIGLREMQIAEMEIIKLVESMYFGKEIVLLSKLKKLEANNRLFKLNPYVDAQGVLRVEGRIQKSLIHIEQEIQHHMLFPKDCRITNLIVSWCHDQTAHTGRGITINQARMSGFCVIGLNIVGSVQPSSLGAWNSYPQQGCSQKFLAQTVSFSKLKAKGLYDMLKACPTQLGVWGAL